MEIRPLLAEPAGSWQEQLAQDPEILERGLRRIEGDLEIGEVRIDLLCADAGHRPVLVYMAREGETDDAPLRVMDGDGQFRRHLPLLRRLLPQAGIGWDLPPRSILVGGDLDRRTLDRFAAMTALEVDLLELRSIRIGGVRRWAGVPVGGEAARKTLLPPEPVPETLEDPMTRNLWDSVMKRVLKLDPDLEILADKYFREVFVAGNSLASLESDGLGFNVRIPHTNGSIHSTRPPRLVPVREEKDADLAVDLVIRRYLAIRAHLEGGREERRVGREEASPPSPDPGPALTGATLTEEELSAFMETEDGNPGGISFE